MSVNVNPVEEKHKITNNGQLENKIIQEWEIITIKTIRTDYWSADLKIKKHIKTVYNDKTF